MPVNRLLVIVLHSHMGSAFWAFFLDNKLMLSLHGAEGLQLCGTTWHEIQGDTGIGGTWESPCFTLRVFLVHYALCAVRRTFTRVWCVHHVISKWGDLQKDEIRLRRLLLLAM